jgi:hypothetical protein
MAIKVAQSKRHKNRIAIAFGARVLHVSIGEAFSLATGLLFTAWSMMAIRLALAEAKQARRRR